jgi:hypothetical protein
MKAHFPTTGVKHSLSYKRISTLLAAFVVVGVLTSGSMIVGGSAAGLNFHGRMSLPGTSASPQTHSPAPRAPFTSLNYYLQGKVDGRVTANRSTGPAGVGPVTITPAAAPTAADNDYTRINNAIQSTVMPNDQTTRHDPTDRA